MKDTIDKHKITISLSVAAVIIIFLIVQSASVSSWKTQMEKEHEAMTLRQNHLSEGHSSIRITLTEMQKEHDEDIHIIEDKANARDIQLTEIKTKLVNIETLLVEIKQDIKNQ